jgi:hypothetical protein
MVRAACVEFVIPAPSAQETNRAPKGPAISVAETYLPVATVALVGVGWQYYQATIDRKRFKPPAILASPCTLTNYRGVICVGE